MVKHVSPDVATQILRPIPAKAFYFARTLGDYTGDVAQSLDEFLEVISRTPQECIEFHLYPRPPDFERWIRETLGDTFLANQLQKITTQVHEGDSLRQALQTVIDNRIRELRAISLTHVKEVGAKTSILLLDAGIRSIDELARAQSDVLATLTGVSEKRATRWIQNAQLFLANA